MNSELKIGNWVYAFGELVKIIDVTTSQDGKTTLYDCSDNKSYFDIDLTAWHPEVGELVIGLKNMPEPPPILGKYERTDGALSLIDLGDTDKTWVVDVIPFIGKKTWEF